MISQHWGCSADSIACSFFDADLIQNNCLLDTCYHAHFCLFHICYKSYLCLLSRNWHSQTAQPCSTPGLIICSCHEDWLSGMRWFCNSSLLTLFISKFLLFIQGFLFHRFQSVQFGSGLTLYICSHNFMGNKFGSYSRTLLYSLFRLYSRILGLAAPFFLFTPHPSVWRHYIEHLF